MRFKTRKVAGVATAAAALIWATGSLANASVSTDGYYYNAGDTVQITGDQMTAGENVTVDVDLPDGSLSQEHVVVADANGEFSDSYTLAADAPDGIYAVAATGQSSGSVYTTTFDPSANTCMTGVSPTGPSVTQTSITVDWSTAVCNDNASTDGYRVKDSTTSGGPYTLADTILDPAQTSDVLSGLDCGTTYYFVVQAFMSVGNDGEQNSTSNEGSATTSACSTSGPTADAGDPYSGNEGSAITLTGSGTGTGTLTYSWSYAIVSAATGASCQITNGDEATASITCNDNGAYTVTLTVSDESGQPAATDSADLTVANVDPSVTAFTPVQSGCNVTISSVSFTDPAGSQDNPYTGSVNWGDGSGDKTTTPATVSYGATFGPLTHTYTDPTPVGGTPYAIVASVTDKDLGTGTATNNFTVAGATYAGTLPPVSILDKSYKSGSTIPVKIMISGCPGSGASTPQLTVTGPNGNLVSIPLQDSGASNGNNTTGSMRWDDSMPGYIYNWQTVQPNGKPLALGTYKITVSNVLNTPATGVGTVKLTK